MAQAKPEQSIQDLLAKNKTLQAILSRGDKLKGIEALVREFLPKSLAARCEVANLKQGCLTLQVPNAALATQIQYQAPELLSVLRMKGGLPGLGSIRVIIRA